MPVKNITKKTMFLHVLIINQLSGGNSGIDKWT